MINSIKNYFKEHWLGMVIALLIGMVVAAPPVIWHFSTGYQGVDMLKTNTEPPYVGFVQEVYDGHPGLGNPYLADSKDNLYLFPPFSANIIAGFGKLFFLSSGVQAVMVSRFFIVSALAHSVTLFPVSITPIRATMKKRVRGSWYLSNHLFIFRRRR